MLQGTEGGDAKVANSLLLFTKVSKSAIRVIRTGIVTELFAVKVSTPLMSGSIL